jgi:ribonucleoside-diphosphate reductase subunit M1
MHFYGWKKGLKTGMYYLRTRPAAQAIQFTVDQSILQKAKEANQAPRASPPVPPPVATVPSVTKGMSSSNSYAPRHGGSGILTPDTPTTTSSPAPSTSNEGSSGTPNTPATNGEKEVDPEYAAALERQKQRELEEAKLLCSIENKEACLMCSG